MRSPLQWWRSLAQADRPLAAAAALALVVAAALWMFWALPRMHQRASLEGQVRALEARILGSMHSQKAAALAESARRQLDVFKNKANAGGATMDLGQWARRAGLTVHEQSFDEKERRSGSWRLQSQALQVEGSYAALERFLTRLRRSAALLEVERAVVERVAAGSLRASLQVARVMPGGEAP